MAVWRGLGGVELGREPPAHGHLQRLDSDHCWEGKEWEIGEV